MSRRNGISVEDFDPFPVSPHVNYLYWHSSTDSDPAPDKSLMEALKTLEANPTT